MTDVKQPSPYQHKKVDEAVDRAIEKLAEDKTSFKVPHTNADVAISSSNVNSKTYAEKLVRQALHELFG